jgi:TatD DNase family protein
MYNHTMIDCHAHLHHRLLDEKLEDIMTRFKQAGGDYILNSAIDLKSSCKVLAQARQYEEIVPTVAVHPETLIPGADIYISSANGKWIKNNLEELDKILDKYQSVAAIGECGLDYYWVKRENIPERNKIFELQRDLFAGHIEPSKQYNLPLVIHCRDERGDKQCEAEILELLVKKGNSCINGVFHSYTGSLSYLKDILALGFYVSFNGIVTYKNADNVRELLDEVPLDRLLLETDSPFLVPYRSRSAGVKTGDPAFVKEVGSYVADFKGINEKRLWNQVRSNFENLFGLS